MVRLELLVSDQENYSSDGRCNVSFAVGKRTNQQLQIGILVKKKLETIVKGVMFV
jgi:hypothetical protein